MLNEVIAPSDRNLLTKGPSLISW